MRPFLSAAIICFIAFIDEASIALAADTGETLEQLAATPGFVCVLDLPEGGSRRLIAVAKSSAATFYFQSADEEQVTTVRETAELAGLLGTKIFSGSGSLSSVHLADNVADGIFVATSATGQVPDGELLRVLRPKATATVNNRKLVKPVPVGIDEWSHPYHGADNNPQSKDQLVRGDFQTQFIAAPKFSPMPQQTVAAGGRIYKAMGHIAHKANQNEMLNTLLCINAYNGTVLWTRPNPPGFMIHRNTMVATNDGLYMGDHESCKIIDAVTGKVRDQITIPAEITDGPVWKWMAIQDGILYGLVGNLEIQVDTQRSDRRGLGHWPWGMWKGHDYKDPEKSFGYGRTFVAIDLKTKQPLWHYRDEQFLDSRATCMKDGRIYCYSPEKFLCCIDAADGQLLWKNADKDLLDAIAPNERAQHYITGYATTCYMKCDSDHLFFAGPQRKQTVVASAKDGKLAWTYPVGNLQLVLRDDAIFAAGQQGTTGVRLDYASGSVLSEFPARRACTRATGCVDSIFYRATGGTVRVMTDTNTATHIAPMRPPCQDGVIISNGHLYWGPWMCGCQLSLYGNIGLAPAGAMAKREASAPRRVTHADFEQVESLRQKATDWVTYRANNSRSDTIDRKLPDAVKVKWKVDICESELPTAPIVAGGLVFIADRTGVVRALDMNGKLVWKQYAAGAVFYPPAIADDRLFVGSADGRVYAFEARTGRRLWSYRVAPEDRLIPIFGKLLSSWPVAGGVVVEDGRVYAAAGLTHYDGTQVVALDAKTGELLVENNTSGQLAEQVNDGVSMQGNLKIVDGELRFLGGGVYETARFDLKTLKCLNTPKPQVTSQFRTAFYPYYPAYGKFVSLEYTSGDGNVLSHDASYEGSMFGNLALHTPLPPGALVKDEAREFLRRRGRDVAKPEKLWEDKDDRRFTSFIASPQLLLTTGHPDKTPDQPFLAAINIKDGTDAWQHALPADAVKGGTAVDGDGRVFVALENGQLWCFAK
ncbi:MAG: PQQ-binding-like beta-propeller repeat protein [Planctomycetes bacterium]|nr:PQQ-binding-like beta-propeller repeat protein [Planctomycetota bacterium]